jgi:polyphosphate kinase
VMVRDPDTGLRRFARVKVPDLLPRFVVLPDGERFVPLEQVIAARLSSLFPGMEIESHHSFRVTRNADLTLEEEEAEDLLAAVEVELRRRRFGRAVRLEVQTGIDEEILTLLLRELDLGEEDVYATDAPLDLSGLWNVWALPRPDLKDPPWKSVPPLRAANDDDPLDVFARIRAGDALVHHPYDSFTDSVAAFIRQAAADPAVLAIKQTLYRTSSDSPIVAALIRAAEAGKQVAALVELKARFDEQANVAWARALEQVGVHVVYGMVGLKTHTKTALVVRQEPGGIRRYCHVGTGNYNEQTARIYEDLGLLTCDPEIGADLSQLFNYLTGYGRQERFRKLVVAPGRLRPTLASLIAREADAGADGRIVLKMNSLVDSDMIDALYDASCAGVDIDLIIRGICCLRPGVPGMSDRIRVRSIVGRYLEHSRIFYFANGDGPDRPAYYIGSADLMPRNLDRRVEAVVPVGDPALQQRLQEVLDINLSDDVLAWRLLPDGSWRKVPTVLGVNTHEALQQRAIERNRRQEAEVVRARGAE